jgi:hypothetical protein
MARPLDLLSNPDAEDLVEDLGNIFGVDFDDATVERWRTAGGVLRAIEEAAVPAESSGPPPAVKAFYLLRKAAGDRSIKPSTPLREVDGTWRASTFLVRLSKRTQLNMPGAPVGAYGHAAMGVFLQTFLTLFVMWWAIGGSGPACANGDDWIVAPVLFGGLGFSLLFAYLDGRAFRGDLKTFGDLARATAQLNLAALWRHGARRRRADVWPALRAWFAAVTDIPEAEIERDSPLGVWRPSTSTRTA